MLKRIFALVMVVLLTGCAATQRISEQDRANVNVVIINQDVKKPDDFYYFGPGSAFGLLFGAVGGAITAAVNQKPGEVLEQFAIENEIYIEEIVRQEVISAMNNSGKFNLADHKSEKASVVNVYIRLYGLSIPNGFSSKLVPALDIRCEMMDPNGRVIWAANDRVSFLNSPVEAITLEELKSNPKKLEDMWIVAAREISNELVMRY
ncbi:MAG: hypothetical protein ACPF9K_10645 [Neptuniibacter sp.]